MTNRMQVIKDGGKLKAELLEKKYNDILGGIYYSHDSKGGVLNVGLVNSEIKGEIIKEIKDNFKHNNIRIYNSQLSYDELKEKQNLIGAIAQIRLDLVNYTSLSEAISTSKVIVSLKKHDDEFIRQLKNLVDEKYLDIKIENKAKNENFLSRTGYQRPLYGGLATYTGTAPYFTGGFSAKDSSGNYYYVSAAHAGSLGSLIKQGGSDVGTVVKWKNSGSVDAMAIQISSSNASSYYMDTSSTARKFNSVGSYAYEYEGAVVSLSGYTSGVSCGTLRTKNWQGPFDGGWFTNMMEATMKSGPGDSGAPVYSQFTDNTIELKGIVKGGDPTYGNPTYYSYIEYIQSDLGVTALTN